MRFKVNVEDVKEYYEAKDWSDIADKINMDMDVHEVNDQGEIID